MNKNFMSLPAMSLWLGFCYPAVYAQVAAVPAGGDATGSGGTVAYTIGQVDYKTFSGSTGIVSQGVQQTYKISGAGIEEFENSLNLFAYPNPTVDFLTLEIDADDWSNFSYQLLDMTGKLLVNGKIITRQTNVPMYAYAPSTYYLKIYKLNNTVKTFTVIKSN